MDESFIEEMKQRFATDSLPNLLGIELLEISEGKAKIRLKVREEHLNLLGATHGGAVFTLADTVMGLAANSYPDRHSVTLNMNINYLRTTTAGDILTAVAKEENLTRKTGVYSAHITNSDNKPVALATGTYYVLSPQKD